MPRLLRMLALVTIVLLVPVVPFLFFGGEVEGWVEQWRTQSISTAWMWGFVVAVLATDILLPIPSSVVSTLAGIRLGWISGTLASWLGMSLGACVGFALARAWGPKVALWFTRESDLATMREAHDRFGAWLLVIARGVPVLAEASVLLAGINRMTWQRFLPPLLLSNFGIAFAYAAFGDFAGRHHWLPAALALAIALPVLLAAVARRWIGRR